MKNRVSLFCYPRFVDRLLDLAHIVRKGVFLLKNPHPIKNPAVSVSLILAVFIFMLFFSPLISSSAFIDVFLTLLVLALLRVSSVWIEHSSKKPKNKRWMNREIKN